MTVIFFGSFQDYSVKILAGLLQADDIEVVGVVTTPPQQIGRKKKLTNTPVHNYALEHDIPVFAPESLTDEALQTLPQTDYFMVAGYGKLLPQNWLAFPQEKSLNIHFSLLPAYRGANPAEWALLAGETETGITLMEMAADFDTGSIYAHKKSAITGTDTRETLYEKLYTLAGEHVATFLKNVADETYQPQPQGTSPTPFAQRLDRQDAWVDWQVVQTAMGMGQTGQSFTDDHFSPVLADHWQQSQTKNESLAVYLERAIRALTGYPTLWTQVKTPKGLKRLKIMSGTVDKTANPARLILEEVQLEGQQPAQFNQIKNSLVSDNE